MRKDDKVLLVRRGRPPAIGQWAIPGGNVKLGETLALLHIRWDAGPRIGYKSHCVLDPNRLISYIDPFLSKSSWNLARKGCCKTIGEKDE